MYLQYNTGTSQKHKSNKIIWRRQINLQGSTNQLFYLLKYKIEVLIKNRTAKNVFMFFESTDKNIVLLALKYS